MTAHQQWRALSGEDRAFVLDEIQRKVEAYTEYTAYHEKWASEAYHAAAADNCRRHAEAFRIALEMLESEI